MRRILFVNGVHQFHHVSFFILLSKKIQPALAALGIHHCNRFGIALHFHSFFQGVAIFSGMGIFSDIQILVFDRERYNVGVEQRVFILYDEKNP